MRFPLWPLSRLGAPSVPRVVVPRGYLSKKADMDQYEDVKKSSTCESASDETSPYMPSYSPRTRTMQELIEFKVPPLTDSLKTEFKSKLSPLQRRITQEHGTERPFTGEYNRHYAYGAYMCVVCGYALFSSTAKYDSGSGWPSFWAVLEQKRVKLTPETGGVASLLALVGDPSRRRIEVSCSRCTSHLGHVFADGPPPTGQRYCINSASLRFFALPQPADSADATDAAAPRVFHGACASGSCDGRRED